MSSVRFWVLSAATFALITSFIFTSPDPVRVVAAAILGVVWGINIEFRRLDRMFREMTSMARTATKLASNLLADLEEAWALLTPEQQEELKKKHEERIAQK